jgi:hypothetical protein
MPTKIAVIVVLLVVMLMEGQATWPRGISCCGDQAPPELSLREQALKFGQNAQFQVKRLFYYRCDNIFLFITH